jgi:DNA-binding CsgD family transcriptional regulator
MGEIYYNMLPEDRLVELAYAAVDDTARWTDFLEAFCSVTNSDMATFVVTYATRNEYNISCHYGITRAELEEHEQRWGAQNQNPWVHRDENRERAFHSPPGLVISSHELCPDEVLEATEVYREFYARRNLHYGAGMVVTSSPFQQSLISTLRAKSKGPVGEMEIRRWKAIFPHLSRAVSLCGELAALRSERRTLVNYVNGLLKPLFLLNRAGSILFANDAADRLVKEGKVAALRNGLLSLPPEKAQKQFVKALKDVGGVDGSGHARAASFRSPNRSGDGAVLVLVKSAGDAKPRLGSHEPAAAVYLIDPRSSDQVDRGDLEILFELTPAESSLAALIAERKTLKQAAAETGVSMNTVRTHLKHILAKTGCRRQAELVALVLRAR